MRAYVSSESMSRPKPTSRWGSSPVAQAPPGSRAIKSAATRYSLPLLDRDADRLDKWADEDGGLFDHVRSVGIRRVVAELVPPDPMADEIARAPEARRPPAIGAQDSI